MNASAPGCDPPSTSSASLRPPRRTVPEALPRRMAWLCVLLVAALAPLQLRAASLGGAPDFLPVDEAFVLGADVEGRKVAVFWQMPPGYYLYRHRFTFETAAGTAAVTEAELPAGLAKTDEYFGDVEVYYDGVRAEVRLDEAPAPGTALEVRYQGCADAGLCYPPQTRWIALAGPAAGSITDAAPTATAAGPTEGAPPGAGAAAAAPGQPVTEEGRLAALLGGDRLGLALAVFFLAGIGLAFTPCVLPMVPILASIVVGEGEQVSKRRATLLSATYVLAMALTYAALGTLVGYFGGALNLHGWLQSPPVLVVFAAVFVALALAMFGFYELRLPAGLQAHLERRAGEGGRLGGVALMGVASSLLVSPCVSAPLAGALVYISATGDAALGGGALFALALGMGVPLMVVGVGGGSLLPRTGPWMNAVKAAFGVLLLGVAVWLLERVLPASLTLVLWAALAVGSGVALGGLDLAPRAGLGQLWKSAGVLLVVYGVLLLVGAASGAADPLRPLAPLADADHGRASPAAELEFAAVTDLADVRSELDAAREAGRPVLLDFYADWCISCKVLERRVFPHPEVRPLLAEFELLRADVTGNAPAHRELLARFDLFGPPSLLFFDPAAGTGATDAAAVELRPFRLQGEIDAPAFAEHLRRVLSAAG